MSARAKRWRAPDFVLAAVAVLVVAAAIAAAVSGPRAGAPPGDVAQRGLSMLPGLGRAVSLAGCAGAFDPRIAPGCDRRCFPLPGGGPPCADHAVALPEGEW